MNIRYLLIFEGLWWCFSLLVAGLAIYPYYSYLITDVPFLIPNIIMAVIMVHCIRHIFFFKQSFLGNSKVLVYLLNFTFIPVCLYVVRHFSEMRIFFDDSSWIHSFSYLLTLTEKSHLATYIKTQFTFIAVTTFISGIWVSVLFVIASWRQVRQWRMGKK